MMRALRSPLSPAAFAAVLWLAGCFSPRLGDGKVACGPAPDNACPPNYTCGAENRCWKTTATADLQMDVSDMSSTDVVVDLAGADFANCERALCGALQCGTVSDNCGSTMDCGMNCPSGESCGGGGQPHVCGCPTQQFCGGRNCGTIPNGCGGVTVCGATCPGGQTCGGAGANVCGPATCTPATNVPCPNAPACGYVSDGCAGVITCKCPGIKTCNNGMCT
jgi:hypothetical protein